MKLEGYTPEIFLENFINDSEVFGEETAKAIYEEIFSISFVLQKQTDSSELYRKE